jgi:hypothetical protein
VAETGRMHRKRGIDDCLKSPQSSRIVARMGERTRREKPTAFECVLESSMEINQTVIN